jgi:hypothetical protein
MWCKYYAPMCENGTVRPCNYSKKGGEGKRRMMVRVNLTKISTFVNVTVYPQ